MKPSNKIATGIAAGALFTGGAAFAATNADAVHLALDSLLVASSKMSVVNATRSSGKAPSSNAEARLGAPNTMTTNEISGITVSQGGVISIYLSPATGTDHGVVQYVPKMVKGKKGGNAVLFDCVSPNIVDIAKVAGDCAYRAAAK
ncbi:MAG: hypothetical protein ABIY40_06685 [Rhodanobacteraceae bacterium]|nr:hypothetical protein [Pseudomonadota bacterium]